MYALCSDAMLKAITRQARAVDDKVKAYNAERSTPITIAYFFDHLATEEDTAVMVTENDFFEANRELVPSVSADEIQHYERVRRAFESTPKKEEQKPQQQSQLSISQGPQGPSLQVQSSAKGKGKGKGVAAAPPDGTQSDEDDYVIRTEHLDLNGSAGSGKGKGKAPASVGHGKGKNSVDIAEGGFGDAAQDDEDMYA